MNKSPFIYCFETPFGKYFYDFNTNAIVKVKEDTYDILANNKMDNMESNNMIKALMNEGFLKSRHWEKIRHPITFMLPHLLESSLKSLTLQVTQQCNLKCNYCPYSGNFHNRNHNDKKMTFDIAKTAIDYYVEHSFDMEDFQIGFYGGEPLIEFKLVKEIVEYVEGRCEGKPVHYRMTTNGTLINDEILEFLMEKDFILTLSLDGPKQYHDRNRHRIDNSGSFDTIMEKIQKIFTDYPDKINNISFNCVLDPRDDLQCVNEFFIKNDMLKEYQVFFNRVSREGIKNENDFLPDENYMEQYKFEIFKLLYNKAGKLKNINVSRIVEAYFSEIKNTFLNRTITRFDETASHPSGPCIPGEHKLFVDVNGNFYPCEKVCECSSDMIIGNVYDGFELDKVNRLLNIGQLTEKYCLNCWCAKFCYMCASHVDTGEGLSREYKLSHCNAVRSSVEDDLKDYCLLQEIQGFDEEIIYL